MSPQWRDRNQIAVFHPKGSEGGFANDLVTSLLSWGGGPHPNAPEGLSQILPSLDYYPSLG